MTDKDDWNGAMKDLIRSYNEPPEIPREEMWTSINGALKAQDRGAEGESSGTVISMEDRRRHRWLQAGRVLRVLLPPAGERYHGYSPDNNGWPLR